MRIDVMTCEYEAEYETRTALKAVDALTPETVLRLDLIADQMLELGRSDDAVSAIRAALIHGVK